MTPHLLHGQLVRLVAPNAATDLEPWLTWGHNSEFLRLLDSDPAQLWTRTQSRTELDEAPRDDRLGFNLRTLADHTLIGFVGLGGIQWAHGDAWLGIGIGEPAYQGRGYGTDAVRVILRFAFTELNLHRVTLGVFGYNARAMRAYEKAGFTVEGRLRQTLHRDGQRHDEFMMGILRTEWEANA